MRGEGEEEEEEEDPVLRQEGRMNGGPHRPHLDQKASGEMEAIQITVEDLGIDNSGFCLSEEEALTPGKAVARSASSVSACTRALKKKRRLKPLSSLPLQPQVNPTITCTSGEDDEEEEEEEDPLLFACGGSSSSASGGLLTRPVINLIPPTPSDTADDDQFFDVNSEESVAHTSGSDGSVAAGDHESYDESVQAAGSTEEELDRSAVSTDASAEPDKGLEDGSEEEPDSEATPETDKTKPRSLCSVYHVAPLPEHPQKSESHRTETYSEVSMRQHTFFLRRKKNHCLRFH